jgi:hypothetical protein
MDQELRAYLDDLKTSIVRQAIGLEGLKATMEERFAQQDARMEERFVQQDARMEERFAQQDARMEERFVQQDKRFEQVEATTYKTQVLLEALDSKVDLVFEGVAAANEKLAAFQKDTACRFEEGQASIAPYYRELNGRLLRVEEAVRVKKSRKRQTS